MWIRERRFRGSWKKSKRGALERLIEIAERTDSTQRLNFVDEEEGVSTNTVAKTDLLEFMGVDFWLFITLPGG